MMRDIGAALTQLSAAFTVRDIMIPAATLVRAGSYADALQRLQERPDIDTIPVPEAGSIGGYARRGSEGIQRLGPHDLISDGLGLLEVPALFIKREFFFVLSGNSIAGFIHFSDLNSTIMKLPYFLMFERVESVLWPVVGPILDAETLREVLGSKRLDDINSRRLQAQEAGVDRRWAGLLYFGELLRVSQHYKVIHLRGQQLDLLANYRNRVAHADHLLIENHKDVQQLGKVAELCLRLVHEVEPLGSSAG